MRFLPALLLLCLASLGFGTVTTTTVDLRPADSANPVPAIAAPANKVVGTSTCDADEDILIIQVKPGTPRTVTLVNAAAWYYRSAASGTNLPVAAGQTITLLCESTTTIYHTRQTADGAVVVVCWK